MEKNKYKNYNIFSSNPYTNLASRIYNNFKLFKPHSIKILDNLKPNSNVLDYGSGSGNLLAKLNMLRPDLNYFSCDICDFMPDNRKIQFNFRLIEDEKHLPFADNLFDLIISQNVLEHLIEPSIMFSESFRMLREDGLILIETPSPRALFMPSLQFLLKIDLEKEKITMNFYDDPTHIRPYTRQALFRLAKSNGFSEIRLYKARNILFLLGLPIHIINVFKRKVSFLIYWFYELYGGANGIIGRKK